MRRFLGLQLLGVLCAMAIATYSVASLRPQSEMPTFEPSAWIEVPIAYGRDHYLSLLLFAGTSVDLFGSGLRESRLAGLERGYGDAPDRRIGVAHLKLLAGAQEAAVGAWIPGAEVSSGLAAVPEPSTGLLVAVGLGALAMVRRPRSR